ncbi:MAG: 1-acyl-sn-glycerol-3-phosphate acyltransferase [Oscillospiraceae bacterium]|nr:1-acyl-sn-glycerol-3-phosphate acyltransferase [Oscillospiraceae bacterium]
MTFYKVVVTILRPIIHFLFSVKYEGLENVQNLEGTILVSNHRSLMDPVFLIVKIKNKLRFMGKQELFKFPPLATIFRAMGVFPVARGKGDKSAIEKSVSIIRNNQVLGIYPEGTRSKTGELLRFKSGVAVIASQTGADVVPACIDYDGKLKFRSKVVIRFGERIPSKDLFDGVIDLDNLRPSQVKVASTVIRERVAGLLEASQN